MHPSLKRNRYFVRERPGMFNAANDYDILDPEGAATLLECREERLDRFTKFLRFTDYKRMTPLDIEVRTPEGEPVFQLERGVSVFVAKVDVLDGTGHPIGSIRHELSPNGGRLEIVDENDDPTCRLVGNWSTWQFRFIDDAEVEYAGVSREWSDPGKGLLPSEGRYLLEIHENVSFDHPLRPLILAALLCIDMAMKE